MKYYLFLFGMILSIGILDAQQIKFADGNNNWNPDSLGNLRAVIHFEGSAKVAMTVIPWRRRDVGPEKKRVIVQDGQTKQRILNILTGKLDRETGVLYFEPVSGRGDYYVYYLPYKNEGRSNYPRGVYLKPDTTASLSWLHSFRPDHIKQNAFCREIQYINAFNSSYPMEVIATASETQNLLHRFAKEDFLVFPEDRTYPIRMKYDLPQRWLLKGKQSSFEGTADKGEQYSFQLGVYAIKELRNLQVSFSDLIGTPGNKIEASGISCINTEGIGYDGTPLKNRIDLPKGQIQALWCTLSISSMIPAGIYKGYAKVKAEGAPVKQIPISIKINNQLAVEGGG